MLISQAFGFFYCRKDDNRWMQLFQRAARPSIPFLRSVYPVTRYYNLTKIPQMLKNFSFFAKKILYKCHIALIKNLWNRYALLVWNKNNRSRHTGNPCNWFPKSGELKDHQHNSNCKPCFRLSFAFSSRPHRFTPKFFEWPAPAQKMVLATQYFTLYTIFNCFSPILWFFYCYI